MNLQRPRSNTPPFLTPIKKKPKESTIIVFDKVEKLEELLEEEFKVRKNLENKIKELNLLLIQKDQKIVLLEKELNK